ncbi:MAG: chemotaxis protein CheW [Bacteriovoracaceae bacterium]|nr:chemotaxis protein CheW [Bacteriovoracaceae bacterium]
MSNSNDTAIQEFISEGNEIFQRVFDSLQALEKGSKDPELLSSLYRDMHTLKGTAQLFGFQNIAKLAHVLEASLDPIRKNNLSISPRLHECCFASLYLFGKLLTNVQNTKSDHGFTDEILRMTTLLIDAATHQFEGEITIENESFTGSERKIDFEKLKPTAEVELKSEPRKLKTVPEANVINLKNDLLSAASVAPVIAAESAPVQEVLSLNAPEATIRVQVGLLDNLMNIIGELVLVRNQVLQFKNKHEDAELLGLSKNLDVVTTQLQTEVMKTRMQPISNVVSKFQRVVRDLAKELNKQIDLTLEGAETELDKTILEAIKDPMTHLVRNSCDHGIETPAQRKSAGKPENGHLLIRAFHEGGYVIVEISDDGKGLDPKKLIAKAIEKNLISTEQSLSMQDKEVYNLIFMPGFSTAQNVTSVSGRGVGMDVVKTNIEKIGGTIDLNSTLGKGMTVGIKIPLTLAIVPALLIKTNGENYAIPQVKLVELVRVEIDNHQSSIEYLHGKPMLRLRGDLVALIDLRELTNKNFSQSKYEDTNIVILNAGGEILGLIVDEISDTADIVVKPLSAFLKYLTLFSGATILGDGTVAIILDVIGMAMAANINTQRTKEIDPSLSLADGAVKKSFDAQEFLLIDVGTNVTHAIPLCLVQRLEEFSLKQLEFSGKQKVVRYRDQLLPILDLCELLNYSKPENSKEQPKEVESIVVVQRSGKFFGIKVTEILDIITADCDIDDTVCDRVGILGNIVHDQTVIVIVDILSLLELKQHGTNGLKKNQTSQVQSTQLSSKNNIERIKSMSVDMKSKKVRVLYAEDVAFFRKHVMKVLNGAGFEVTVFENGAKALAALDKSYDNQFNLILSDIEMPEMDGLEFAKQVRKRNKFNDIPMIALTTRFKQSDIDAGVKAGFTSYMEKLDPEKLLKQVAEIMNLNLEDIRRAEA